MNGEGRRATARAAMLRRPGTDFGPIWPEVANPFVVDRLNQATIFTWQPLDLNSDIKTTKHGNPLSLRATVSLKNGRNYYALRNLVFQ